MDPSVNVVFISWLQTSTMTPLTAELILQPSHLGPTSRRCEAGSAPTPYGAIATSSSGDENLRKHFAYVPICVCVFGITPSSVGSDHCRAVGRRKGSDSGPRSGCYSSILD